MSIASSVSKCNICHNTCRCDPDEKLVA